METTKGQRGAPAVRLTDTDGLTAALFPREIEADRPATTLDYDALKHGVIVVHKGIRPIEYKKDGVERRTKLHLFASKAGGGPWFSVFGSANLDSQIRKAHIGAVILLRYLGKEKVDPTSDQEQHMWEVRETAATADQISVLRGRVEWRERELSLDAAITAAAHAERERRDARANGGGAMDDAPPHDDTDRTF